MRRLARMAALGAVTALALASAPVFAESPTPSPSASGTSTPTPPGTPTTQPAATPSPTPSPCSVGLINGYLPVVGAGPFAPTCIVSVTAAGPEKLYTLSPAPIGLRQRAVERGPGAQARVTFENSAGQPVLAITWSKVYLVPNPVGVASASQVTAAPFLPTPGVVVTDQLEARWIEPASGAYRLLIDTSLTSLSVQQLVALLTPLTTASPGPPATGTGRQQDSDENRAPWVAWALGAVLAAGIPLLAARRRTQ